MSFELRFEYDVVDNYGLQDELDVGEGVILMMAIKGGYLAMFSASKNEERTYELN